MFDATLRRASDQPPPFHHPQRQLFLALPDWAPQFLATLRAPHSRGGFVLQVGYFTAQAFTTGLRVDADAAPKAQPIRGYAFDAANREVGWWQTRWAPSQWLRGHPSAGKTPWGAWGITRR